MKVEAQKFSGIYLHAFMLPFMTKIEQLGKKNPCLGKPSKYVFFTS